MRLDTVERSLDLDIKSHYDSSSNAYDCETNGQFYKFFARNLVEEIAAINNKIDSVLEIGCGCGFSTLELVKFIDPKKIVAIDISGAMLNKAATKKELDGVNFYLNSNDLNNKFDLIFSSFSYHWWSDEQIKALPNLLNPDGTIALCAPARKPDLLSGNMLISQAINKIKNINNSVNGRLAGLTIKKIQDDFASINRSLINIKSISYTENFYNLFEFVNLLEVKGGLLALSKYYGVEKETLKNELLDHQIAELPIKMAWKAYIVII
jgi:SAM-dependent methyltransferase